MFKERDRENRRVRELTCKVNSKMNEEGEAKSGVVEKSHVHVLTYVVEDLVDWEVVDLLRASDREVKRAADDERIQQE